MSTDYNYGPRMNIEELRRTRVHSTTIPSEYLDVNGFDLRSSESIGSNQSYLGSHWKKIPSSIESVVPSTPRTSSSLMSRTGFTSVSMKSNELSRSDSSSTIHGNPAISLDSLSDSLRQSTEAREESDCLQLQMAGLMELQPVIEEFTEQLASLHMQQLDKFSNITQESKKNFKRLEQSIDYMDETVDDTINNYEKTVDALADKAHHVLRRKQAVEEFVRAKESFPLEGARVMNKMEDNLKIVAKIRQNLEASKPETAPLTVFAQENVLMKTLFEGLVEMVKKLPLNEYERRDFDFTIKKTGKYSEFENRAKCEQIIRHLMTVMYHWENDNESSSSCYDTADWNSLATVSSTVDVLKVPSEMNRNFFGSASFAMTDDSNLNDLEGELRSSAIRVAVEGPHQVYECSPWNPSSISSGGTIASNDIQSLKTTAIGHSTCSSLSERSMPTFEEAHQNLIRSASRSSMKASPVKTAYSLSDPVLSRPPRSFDEKSLIQSATGAPTSVQNPPSLNFSTVSLSEMVEDVIHTAKDAAESPAVHLLEALHNSARKCGQVVSELMTAISTSSESLSDASQPSINH